MNEFIAGAFTGFTQIAVGYPFDTLKVLLQNKQSIHYSNFKIQHLYRGVKYPLFSNTIINSLLFNSYHNSKSYIRHDNKYVNNYFCAGFLSGLFVSPIIFITDIGKTTRQINQSITFQHLYRVKGLPVTMTRESLAYGLYFYTYEKLNEYNSKPLINGGIAGLVNWGLTYPIDVIKNRQVAQNISLKKAFQMGNFWKGYSICLIRALIVNGTGFYIYEKCKNNISIII